MVLAGRFVEARRLFGVCRGSVISPMMGDRRVVRRTCPSSVGLLRDSQTPTCSEAAARSTLPTYRAAVEFGGLGVSSIVLHRVAWESWRNSAR